MVRWTSLSHRQESAPTPSGGCQETLVTSGELWDALNQFVAGAS
jgi:hypothetical protein